MSDPLRELAPGEEFARRHLGPSPEDVGSMLETLGLGSLDELIKETVPRSIRDERQLDLPQPLSEQGRERLMTEILALYDIFVARVSEGRGLTAEQVDAVGRGRVWTGVQAQERGDEKAPSSEKVFAPTNLRRTNSSKMVASASRA